MLTWCKRLTLFTMNVSYSHLYKDRQIVSIVMEASSDRPHQPLCQFSWVVVPWSEGSGWGPETIFNRETRLWYNNLVPWHPAGPLPPPPHTHTPPILCMYPAPSFGGVLYGCISLDGSGTILALCCCLDSLIWELPCLFIQHTSPASVTGS